MFYQHNQGSVDTDQMFPDTALTAPSMWGLGGQDAHAVHDQIAAQNDVTQTKDLSPDLMGIELKPFNKYKSGEFYGYDHQTRFLSHHNTYVE